MTDFGIPQNDPMILAWKKFESSQAFIDWHGDKDQRLASAMFSAFLFGWKAGPDEEPIDRKEENIYRSMRTAPRDGRVVLGTKDHLQFTMRWHTPEFLKNYPSPNGLPGFTYPDGSWIIMGYGKITVHQDGSPVTIDPDGWCPLPSVQKTMIIKDFPGARVEHHLKTHGKLPGEER